MDTQSYGPLCTAFYDLDKPEPPAEMLAYYWRLYEEAGGPVLAAMCGSGRFLLSFAARGADVDGVDASLEMLAACQARLEARGLTANLYEQRLEMLELPRKYRYAFVPAGSFVLVDADSQAEALQRLAACMEPGGLVAIEMPTPAEPNSFAPSDAARRAECGDGSEIVLTVDATGAHRYELRKNGAVLKSEVEYYGWHPRGRAEFVAMLEVAGFVDIQALRPYSDEPAGEGDGLIVYRARREG